MADVVAHRLCDRPVCAGCVLAERYWPARNLFVFFLQIAVLLPLFPLALALIFRKEAVSPGAGVEQASQRCRIVLNHGVRNLSQPRLGEVGVIALAPDPWGRNGWTGTIC